MTPELEAVRSTIIEQARELMRRNHVTKRRARAYLDDLEKAKTPRVFLHYVEMIFDAARHWQHRDRDRRSKHYARKNAARRTGRPNGRPAMVRQHDEPFHDLALDLGSLRLRRLDKKTLVDEAVCYIDGTFRDLGITPVSNLTEVVASSIDRKDFNAATLIDNCRMKSARRRSLA